MVNFDADTHLVESAAGNGFERTSTVGGLQHNIEQISLINCSNANIVRYSGPR
jgi:hypothetical protein